VAELHLKRQKLDLNRRKEEARAREEKLAKAEKEVERLSRGDAKGEQYWKLYTRCTRSLHDLCCFLENGGLPPEDIERFKNDFDGLRKECHHLSGLCDRLWHAFIEPPPSVKNSKEYTHWLMERLHFTEDDAEDISSETEIIPPEDRKK
jgi:hypothetical protein